MKLQLCVAILSITIPSAFAADPPKDTHGDPLPAGAKARMGTERLRNLDQYGTTQLSYDGKSLIASSGGVFQYFDFTTGQIVGKFSTGRHQLGIISGDGKRVASPGYQSLTVWELGTSKVISEIKRTNYVSTGPGDLSLSHDGKCVAFSGAVDDKKKAEGVSVVVYDVEEKKEIAQFKVAQNSHGYVMLSGDGKTLMTWGYHNEETKAGERPEPETRPGNWIQFWDVDTKKEITTLKLNSVPNAKVLTKDGLQLIGCSGDSIIRFWDTRTGKLKRELVGRSKAGNQLELSADDKTLASICSDGAVQLWNLTDGKSLSVTACPFATTYFTAQSFRFTGKDSAVILGQNGACKVVWELPSGKLLTTPTSHVESISGLVFVNNDQEIWSTTDTGNTLKWSPDGKELGPVTFKIPGAPTPTEKSSNHVTFHSTGAFAIRKESYGNESAIFDLPSAVQRTVLPTGNSYFTLTNVSADGQLAAFVLAPAYSDKPKPSRVLCIDLTKDIKSTIFELPPGTIYDSRMTLDGKKLVINREVKGEKDKLVYLTTSYELPSGRQLGEAELYGYYNNPKLTIHPDGKTLFAYLEKGEHGIFDLSDMKKIRVFKSDKSSADLQLSTPAVFDREGTKLAVAYSTGYGTRLATIRVFDWKTGEITHTFQGHAGSVNALAFSKDGKTLATGSADTTVLLWDLAKK